MKKSISHLDYIVNISARKLQYFEYIKSKTKEFKKYQEAIKDTIANMDNSIFLAHGEIKIKDFQDKINLDENKIDTNFKDAFKKRHPELDFSSIFTLK